MTAPSHRTMSVFWSVTAASFVITYVAAAFAVAIPSIGEDLGLIRHELAFVITVYSLFTAVLLVPFGRLSDIVGRKRIFITGLALFFIFCVLTAMLTHAWMLYPLVILGGIGSAMCFSNVLSILSLYYPADKRGQILGMNVAAAYVGSSSGPLLGGLITSQLGWRGVFLTLSPLVAMGLIAGIKAIPSDQDRNDQQFDYPGTLAYCLAAGMFILGVSALNFGYGKALLAASILVGGIFIRMENRRNNPLLDLGLFSNRVFGLSNLAALIHYGATYAVTLMISLYLQDENIKGLEAALAGLVLLAQPILQVICSPVAGALSDRFDGRWLASGGMALTMAGLIALQFLSVDTPVVWIVVILAFMGIGYAFFAAPNNNIAMSSVTVNQYGVASGIMATSRIMGMSVSLALSTMILGSVATYSGLNTTESFMNGLILCFRIFAGLSLLGIVASMSRNPAAKLHRR